MSLMPTSVNDLDYNTLAQGGYTGQFSGIDAPINGTTGQMPGIGGLDALTAALGQQGKFGLNVPTIGLALQGLGTIGSLWAGFKQLSLANKQFEYTKKITDTNLDNSIKSYNTSLADRARARAFTEGRSQDEADSYVEKNKMTRS